MSLYYSIASAGISLNQPVLRPGMHDEILINHSARHSLTCRLCSLRGSRRRKVHGLWALMKRACLRGDCGKIQLTVNSSQYVERKDEQSYLLNNERELHKELIPKHIFNTLQCAFTHMNHILTTSGTHTITTNRPSSEETPNGPTLGTFIACVLMVL